MKTRRPTLPDDVAALKAALLRTEAELAVARAKAAAEQAVAKTTHVAAFARQRPARRPFSEHLPRERIVEPAPTTCACCGSSRLRKLGEDVTETLEVIPRQWKVIQRVREKFTCRDCEKISQAPAPFHVTPRGWAGPSLLAMILFEKFGQHQPLNRQAERYAKEGVPLSLSTLADQVGAGCAVLEPLIDPRLGSRRNQHQKALPLVERFSTFDRDIPVDRVKVPKVVAVRGTGAQVSHDGAAKRRTPSATPVRVPVSLNPEASQDGLPPIDFKHLERAEDYVGETAWLAAVVRRIAVLRPHIQISMSHFFLKKGREFSEIGRGRRACLVALFQFPDRPPAVLIDVDHTGLRGLAAIMLRYTAECPFADIEGHIKTLLDALVGNSGKWDRKAEGDLPSFVTCSRQKKVLRRQVGRTPEEMLSVWTQRLLHRLAQACSLDNGRDNGRQATAL